MNAIQKLEEWNNKSKNHHVMIDGPIGGAASCWQVTLTNGFKKVICSETTFLSYEGVNDYWYENGEDGNLYCCVVSGKDDFDDWPGLEATILKAIECAEKFWPEKSDV